MDKEAVFLFTAVIIGLIPAIIAKIKGRSFCGWWIYGASLFVVALPHALIMKPTEQQQLTHGMKRCPYCAELIKKQAVVCRYCGKDQPIENPENHSEPVAAGLKDASKGKFTIKITGPDDPQKVYLITKELCKDLGIPFEKAKQQLSSGTILKWRFEDMEEALKSIEKYNELGCKAELYEG